MAWTRATDKRSHASKESRIIEIEIFGQRGTVPTHIYLEEYNNVSKQQERM